MTTILGSRRDALGNTTAFYDQTTGETLIGAKPILFDDDFLGVGHTAGIPAAGSPVAGYSWVKKIVGSGPPTVAIVASGAGGIVQIALTSTSEKEDAALYFGDQLLFDMTKAAQFECRLAMAVLPSAAQVEMVWGLQSAWIDGPDNASYYAQFQALASGAVNMRTKDGVNTLSAAAPAAALVANAYHNFRIDATDPTNVCFYIDGVQQNARGAFSFAATGSSAVLQPYISCYKASGTGVGTIDLDMVQAMANRQ